MNHGLHKLNGIRIKFTNDVLIKLLKSDVLIKLLKSDVLIKLLKSDVIIKLLKSDVLPKQSSTMCQTHLIAID
jgi:hypothetical protein